MRYIGPRKSLSKRKRRLRTRTVYLLRVYQGLARQHFSWKWLESSSGRSLKTSTTSNLRLKIHNSPNSSKSAHEVYLAQSNLEFSYLKRSTLTARRSCWLTLQGLRTVGHRRWTLSTTWERWSTLSSYAHCVLLLSCRAISWGKDAQDWKGLAGWWQVISGTLEMSSSLFRMCWPRIWPSLNWLKLWKVS